MCRSLLKLTTMIVNFLVGLAGVGMLTSSIILFNSMTASIAEVGSQHHGSVNWVNIHFATLFSVGVLMMILGGIGCRGVIHENPFLLGVFSCIALILSMMEIGMCVYISIHKNDFMKFVNDNFMDVYRVDAPAVQLMDYIQSTWKCCGKYGPLDWTLNIPPSCCKQPVTKGCNTNLITAGAAAFFGVGYKSSIYTEGCQTRLLEYTASYYPTLVYVIVLALAVQISSAVLSIILCCRSTRKQHGNKI